MTIGEFITAVLRIKDSVAARRFFTEYVEELRKMPNAPEDPVDTARSNIGWCFGEGMDLDTREIWRRECGAYHPAFGEMRTNPTFEEALQLGMRIQKEGLPALRPIVVPTAWERILKDEDDGSV